MFKKNYYSSCKNSIFGQGYLGLGTLIEFEEGGFLEQLLYTR